MEIVLDADERILKYFPRVAADTASELSEMPVWELIAKDAEEGARVLVEDYGARLYATAFQLCLDAHAAEDLVQRTLVRVVGRIAGYKGESAFFTWMCAIMVNFRRMDVRRKAANALVFDEERLDVSDEKPDPGEALSRRDEGAALRGAVLRLPEDLRLVVVMHYFNGFSVPEIAKTVQSPEGTVYYRLHEARQRIRKYLSKVFDTPGIKSSEGARQ